MAKMMKLVEEVVIVGGGIAGLATALALKRVGVRALVLERSKELRTEGTALTLAPNAWNALEALGVAKKLTTIYAPYSKLSVTNVDKGSTQEVLMGPEGYVHNKQGQVQDSKFRSEWEAIGPRAVHRRVLLETLAEGLPSDMIRFSSKLRSIESQQHENDSSSSSINIIRLEDGTTIQAKVLIGCDGVHSVVARWLGLRDPVHSGRFAVRGIAVFPEGHGLKHEVRQFVNKGRRAGIGYLNDRELFWFMVHKSLSKKAEEEMATGDSNLIQKNVLEDLVGFPPILLDAIQHSDLSTLSWAPLMFRYPWNLIYGPLSKGTITVAGDSMHPMTPDLGQGGCLALEDAVVLGRHIGNSKSSQQAQWHDAEIVRSIEMYTKQRRWRGAAMITASYLSGWIQQGGGGVGGDSRGDGEMSGWLARFVRDTVFYKTLVRKIFAFVNYDCGKLPSVSPTSHIIGNHHQIKKRD